MHKILKRILEGLQSQSDKIKVVDHNRIIYLPSTIEIYMNGHETVFSRGGEVIGTGDDLDDKESQVIYAIRGTINPHDDIISRREKMVEHFTSKEVSQVPEPMGEVKNYPVDESDEDEVFEL